MPTYPIIEKLPDAYLRAIGEVITAWSVQEAELKAIVYLILDVGPKRGRIAIRSPRASEMVQMINDLLHIDGLSPSTDFKALESLLNTIESRRNQVAHDIWLQGPNGTLVVQEIQGSWPKDRAGVKVKKRIDPGGNAIAESDLLDLVGAIRQTILRTRSERIRIEAQLAALRKSRLAQSAPEGSPVQTPEPHTPPQTPSQV